MIGYIMTDEHKAKISTAMTGVKKSEEACENMSKASTGQKKSEEHKKNISEGKKGKPLSENHKDKLRKPKTKREPEDYENKMLIPSWEDKRLAIVRIKELAAELRAITESLDTE